MKVLIIGAAGMVGKKLTDRLVKEKGIAGNPISFLLLHDIIQPDSPTSELKIETRASDLSLPGQAERLIEYKPDFIFHLAAIVSGEAEAALLGLPGRTQIVGSLIATPSSIPFLV